MPAHDLGQGEPERLVIEAARQVQGARHVVGGAGPFELIEKPQALLGEGERQRLIARGDGNVAGGGLHGAFGRRFPSQRRAQPLGELSDAGGFKEPAHRDGHTQGVAQPRDELGGQQRMTTEFEEVVVNAQHRLLEHRAPEADEDLLKGIAGTCDFQRDSLPLRRRQRLAINLAVGGERQRREEDKGGGHHIVGQARPEGAAQLARVEGRSPPALGNHIGHQSPSPTLSPRARTTASRMAGWCGQRGFDLSQLDPEAADLDLMIQAVQGTRCCRRPDSAPDRPSCRVVRPRSAEGVGDEFFSRESGRLGSPGRDLRHRCVTRQEPRSGWGSDGGRGCRVACLRSGDRWARPSPDPYRRERIPLYWRRP